MKKTICLIIALAAMLLLGGCGKDESKQAAGKTIDDLTSSDSLYEDNGVLFKLLDELKGRPELKGKELKVFQTFEIGEDRVENRYLYNAKIFLLKPGSEKDVIAYEYSTDSKNWKNPQPVKVVGKGDITNNLIPYNDIHVEKIPVMCKLTREKAAALKNVKISKVKTDLMIQDLRPYWRVYFTGMKGDTLVNGTAKFDLQGNMQEYYQDDQK